MRVLRHPAGTFVAIRVAFLPNYRVSLAQRIIREAREMDDGVQVGVGSVLALVTLHELAPYVVQVTGALPRWAPPALAGLLHVYIWAMESLVFQTNFGPLGLSKTWNPVGKPVTVNSISPAVPNAW